MVNGKFWLGVVAGAIVGAAAYRCARTERARMFHKEMCERFRRMGHKVDEYADKMTAAAVEAGVKVADRVAERAEDAKDKAHAFASEYKK